VDDGTRVEGVAQVAVNAKDVARATAFWRDVLRIPFLFAPPGGRLAFFQCGAVRVMLAAPERPEFDHPASVLYLKVKDLRAAHARLVAAGVSFREPPTLVARMPDHELWMAFFSDSEGNPLALMSEMRAAAGA
jgi:methylmalonyl-CoA/ethylmalonyl-CoA epimerase